MKNYKPNELQAIQKRQNYKHVALFDSFGNAIVKFNTNAIDPQTRLTEILTRLNSEGLPDGTYIFKGKNSPSKNVYSDDYTVIKGKEHTLSEAAPVLMAPQNFSPDVLSYDSALKMQVENERLKIENLNLLQKIEDLEFQLSENETLSEDAAPNLFESGKSFLSEIVAMAAPLLDKHFELKEKQLSLQAMAMQNKMNTRRPSPEQAPQQKTQQHIFRIEAVQNWINGFKEDEETYNKLATFYNNAKSQNDFIESLQNEPELFTDFENNVL